MPLHVSSTCAHHQEVKIALHSLWYHHTYRCDDTRGTKFLFYNKFISYFYMFQAHVLIIRRSKLHYTASGIITPNRCDGTRGYVIQFWPPDDEHICSKHVEAWNKLIVKQKFCASRWLITEINILGWTVSKTSKLYDDILKVLFPYACTTHFHFIPQLTDANVTFWLLQFSCLRIHDLFQNSRLTLYNRCGRLSDCLYAGPLTSPGVLFAHLFATTT